MRRALPRPGAWLLISWLQPENYLKCLQGCRCCRRCRWMRRSPHVLAPTAPQLPAGAAQHCMCMDTIPLRPPDPGHRSMCSHSAGCQVRHCACSSRCRDASAKATTLMLGFPTPIPTCRAAARRAKGLTAACRPPSCRSAPAAAALQRRTRNPDETIQPCVIIRCVMLY